MHSMWPAKFQDRASRSQQALASQSGQIRAKTAWGGTLCKPQFFGSLMIGGPIRRVPHPVRPAMLNFRANKLIFGPNQVGEALQGQFFLLSSKNWQGVCSTMQEKACQFSEWRNLILLCFDGF